MINLSGLIETPESHGRMEQKYARKFLNPFELFGLLTGIKVSDCEPTNMVGESTL
jgi:hypothetical protein